MDILQFVEKHLGKYKIEGKEIKVEECPFCHSTEYKFSINKNTGLFQCWRGSCENSSGHINTFYKKYGETNIFLDRKKKQEEKKVDKNFVIKITDDEMREFGRVKSQKLLDFLTYRGIDYDNIPQDIIAEYRGVFSFVYKMNNLPKMIKFAKAEEKNFWQKEGGIPILWNIDNTDKTKSLLITEGEWDTLCLLSTGIKNVCSVPFGVANLNWIDNCWEELEKYPEIVLALDTDEAGQEAIQKIVKRLGIKKVKMVKSGNEKDFNDLLMAEGKESVLKHLKNKMEIKVDGLFYGEDLRTGFDKKERLRSGIREYDKCSGGIRFGEVTTLSGYTGAGKSTILNQIKAEIIEQGYKVGVYSKELPQEQYISNFALQCSKLSDREKYYDDFKEKWMYKPTKEFLQKFKSWLGKRFVFLDKENNYTEKELIETMKITHQRDGVNVFFIDNLMKIRLTCDNGKWDTQADLMDSIVNFAQYYNVHIFLVAHPKKPDGNKLNVYDVAGASEIVNLSHNVVFITKLEQAEKEKMKAKNIECDSVMIMKKNRFDGDVEKPILLQYDYNSKRLYSNDFEKEKTYSVYNENKEEDLEFMLFQDFCENWDKK